jgi:hypothetical protein
MVEHASHAGSEALVVSDDSIDVGAGDVEVSPSRTVSVTPSLKQQPQRRPRRPDQEPNGTPAGDRSTTTPPGDP